MLVKIIEILELQKSISLISVKNDFFKLSAKRPKYEILKLDKIIDSNLIEINSWEQKIQSYIAKIK